MAVFVRAVPRRAGVLNILVLPLVPHGTIFQLCTGSPDSMAQ